MRDLFSETYKVIDSGYTEGGLAKLVYLESFLGHLFMLCLIGISFITLLIPAMVLMSRPFTLEDRDTFVMLYLVFSTIGALAYFSYFKRINQTVSDAEYRWAKKVHVTLGMPMPVQNMTKADLMPYISQASEFYLASQQETLKQLSIT